MGYLELAHLFVKVRLPGYNKRLFRFSSQASSFRAYSCLVIASNTQKCREKPLSVLPKNNWFGFIFALFFWCWMSSTISMHITF